ncbi:GNAT family N-acetyltransferase [Kineococcus indalonis]|uniref:GNAT family N-acetyltransferase n=1 Tax=Kineococcus indalonis TaxID=2696566 RepID=UPI0014130CEF|nr:GNAT family N-acetyltransferase [Kineococcus indalonis]NAZ86168.1 GNAT family N-acetyltransferase [Kineococcus indalonis]
MQLRPSYPVLTPRLRLRPLSGGDLEALLAYRGRADVCRYLPFAPMDEQALRARLTGPFARTELTGEGQSLTLGVEDRAGRLVGDVVLFLRDERTAEGEVGWVLHPDATGRGYATEACRALLGLAFGELGLHRAGARVHAGNAASARLAVRLGMRPEGRLVRAEPDGDGWADLLLFGLLAEEHAVRVAGG